MILNLFCVDSLSEDRECFIVLLFKLLLVETNLDYLTSWWFAISTSNTCLLTLVILKIRDDDKPLSSLMVTITMPSGQKIGFALSVFVCLQKWMYLYIWCLINILFHCSEPHVMFSLHHLPQTFSIFHVHSVIMHGPIPLQLKPFICYRPYSSLQRQFVEGYQYAFLRCLLLQNIRFVVT